MNHDMNTIPINQAARSTVDAAMAIALRGPVTIVRAVAGPRRSTMMFGRPGDRAAISSSMAAMPALATFAARIGSRPVARSVMIGMLPSDVTVST